MPSINHPLSIVFFGNEKLSTGVIRPSAPSLQALIESPHTVKALILSQRSGASDTTVKEIAKSHDIPVIATSSIAENIDEIKQLEADIGVLAAFGQIVPKSLLEIFKHGIINIHPSLLPKYRGPTPVEQAILDGVKTSGVSIMRLSEQMDAGDILAQSSINIPPHINSGDLAELLAKVGSSLLLNTLGGISNGSTSATAQDDSQASYCRLIEKKDGLIDWQKPAEKLEREIRAYSNWPGSYTHINGKQVIIIEAFVDKKSGNPGKVYMSHNNKFGIYCGEQSLIIERIQPAGKKEMNSADFARGYLKIS